MRNINIGGEDRPISFSRNALIEFEKTTGIKLMSGRKDWFESAESWTALMYAGLKWGLYDPNKGKEPKPDFTIHMVNDWIEARIECLSEMWEIFNASMPKINGEKKSEVKSESLSHGSNSTE